MKKLQSKITKDKLKFTKKQEEYLDKIFVNKESRKVKCPNCGSIKVTRFHKVNECRDCGFSIEK